MTAFERWWESLCETTKEEGGVENLTRIEIAHLAWNEALRLAGDKLYPDYGICYDLSVK